jgi:hypothetical protein
VAEVTDPGGYDPRFRDPQYVPAGHGHRVKGMAIAAVISLALIAALTLIGK